jgi:cyclophilin family peptidyl-prolyl cis-trans isomerase/HEAT repeat protein
MKTALLCAAVVFLGGFAVTAGQRAVPLQTLREAAQPLGAEPVEVLELEKAWAGVEPLMQLATSRDVSSAVRNAAVRAMGRLEDPRAVPQLLSLPASAGISVGARADAIAQSLHGFDPAADAALVRAATEWMLDIGSIAITNRDQLALVMPVVEPLASIRYPLPEDVHRAASVILKVLNFSAPDFRLEPQYAEAVRAFETLARTNQRVTPLDEASAERLKKTARGDSSNDREDSRFHAFLALNSGRALDPDTVKEALKDSYWQLRRAAATVVAGGGGLDDEARLEAIRGLLEDTSPQVRYEAVRGFARRGVVTLGCDPLEAMTKDRDLHVALAAIDALGDTCKADTELTDRIAEDLRVPPAVGSWHRDTHAFVALAKRSPEKAAPLMEAFVTHPVWWVRMYSAGAAAAAGDLLRLEKLAFDANDNVRQAALGAWRKLKKSDADPAILEALELMDVELVRSAASLLKDSTPGPRHYKALMSALARLTREGKETSRDARLMILEAVAIHGAAANANELEPYLKDFDPKIAEKAAQMMTGWTGSLAMPVPVPYRRGWPQAFKDLRQCVAVQMSNAGTFRVQMAPSAAPVTVDRFLKLALVDKYYNGLTIHRVVPNFVLQGGSPNANEYAGAKEFMRDEIGGRNVRGSLGLSTRGRNTADAQFFINLVDNTRLNGDYTVFAHVPATDHAVIDRIQEGDVITSINATKCAGK